MHPSKECTLEFLIAIGSQISVGGGTFYVLKLITIGSQISVGEEFLMKNLEINLVPYLIKYLNL